MSYKPRLKVRYDEEIHDKLQAELGLSNPMEVPTLEKIVLNMGLGEAIQDKTRRQMRPLRSRMQIVFQDPFASLNPRMSIRQIVEEGLIVNNIGSGAKDRLERVKQALFGQTQQGVIIAGDEKITLGDTAAIVSVLMDAGVKNFGIQVQPPKGR